MSSSGKADAINLQLNLLSIGVFVGTTLLSQWLQNKYKRDKLRQRRRQQTERGRRRSLRSSESLSPDTSDLSGTRSWNPEEEEDSNSNTAANWYHHLRGNRRLSFHDLIDSSHEDDLTEDEADFSVDDSRHAFNSNWQHFERYHYRSRDDNDSACDTTSADASLASSSGAFPWTIRPSEKQRRHTNSNSSKKKKKTKKKGHLPVIFSEKQMLVDSDNDDNEHHPPLTNPDRRDRSLSHDHVFGSLNEPHHQRRASDSGLPKIPLPSDQQQKPYKDTIDNPTPMNRFRQFRTQSTSDLRHLSGNNSLEHLESIKLQSRAARTNYNAHIMPQKVVMVRHGQSAGNVNESLYSSTPDNAMPLTPLGWEQARAAGLHLKNNVLEHPDRVHFIVSPYVRTVETFHGIASAWCDPNEFRHITDRELRVQAWYGRLREMGLTWREDPRIREQDFGNYQQPDQVRQYKRERALFGSFYYRFPHGESGSDVFDRISTFLDSLWRSFDMHQSRHYVLVTHGIAIRVLLTRYFRYTVDQFQLLANPKNCEMVVLEHDNRGRLELNARHELELEDDPNKPGKKHVRGYREHERLRVIPEQYIRRVKIRMSQDDE